jgi:CMP/dCMP kinase
MIVAIDGLAGVGKGTLAKRLAERFRLRYLDTGALYRGVARDVLAAGHRPTDIAAAVAAARKLDAATLDDPGLRTEQVGEGASIVAAIPAVREALLQYQRDFAHVPPGAVLDGRDIGTVVCPDADAKFFVTASPEVRADRRWRQLQAKGVAANFDEVLAQIRDRDERDTKRNIAPAVGAADAITLNTDAMDAEAVFLAAERIVALRAQK